MSLFRISLALCLILCTHICGAEQLTSISGHSPELGGKAIYVYGFHDHISESKELLDSTTIDVAGDFFLQFRSEEIRYVRIVSDHISANIYTEPGQQYDIELPLPDAGQPKSFGRKSKVEVIFNNLDLNDINALVIDFNYNYELFFQSNYETLRKLFSPRNYADLHDSISRPSSAISSVKELFAHSLMFSNRMDSLYQEYDSPFFELYRSSVLGDLMMNSSATPREIFENYIEPYEFNDQHPEYTYLHERFFKFYLARYAQSYGEEELNTVLNDSADYILLKELFAKDDFLKEPDRKDIVIINGIEEVWASNAMNHSSLIKVLKSMSTAGSSDMTRKMAAVMIEKLTATKKGFAPKDIEFEDQFKDKRKISDFVGRPLLIQFWAPWCSACSIETEHLTSLKESYEEVFEVLSVEVIESEMNLDSNDKEEVFINATASAQSEWISSYQVLSLPHYVLIDAEGKVMLDNCPMPSQGLESILHKIKADSKTSRRRGIGRKDN